VQLFKGHTADDVWRSAVKTLRTEGAPVQEGRGGATREILRACFEIERPQQRWVVSREPAMNPAFALAEVMWIVNGRNESDFLNFWNTQLPAFAGFGATYHGAYGYRLRRQFGLDQLERAFQALQGNPLGRQVVLQIWDPRSDFPREDGSPVELDIPCNVASLLKVRNNRLEWTQVMRSNDLFLGTPHNFVQFTALQEIMAGWLGLEMGSYFHLSDSLHVYEESTGSDLRYADIEPEPNLDSLGLPRDESQAILSRLYATTARMTLPDLPREELQELALEFEASVAYKNILTVMGAESARRRNWQDTAEALMAHCTNPAYAQMWQRWCKRTGSLNTSR